MVVEQLTRAELYPEGKDSRSVQPAQIPQALLCHPQWVCWRYVDRGADRKPDKQPVNPHNRHNAGVHWQNTWAAFDTAYETYLSHQEVGISGIGFVLTPQDPFVVVDIDQCIGDERVNSQAIEVLETLQSYTEISPSGTGIHILVACPDFHDNRRTQAVEIYSHSRYVTFTGQHVAGTPQNITTVTSEILASLVPHAIEAQQSASQTHHPETPHYPASDQELWQRIFTHDKYGDQHWRRFNGDVSLDRGDHSFTVIRLLNCLARWTKCDAERMRALILMSPLANEKWFDRRGAGDWLAYQIADAIAYVRGRQ